MVKQFIQTKTPTHKHTDGQTNRQAKSTDSPTLKPNQTLLQEVILTLIIRYKCIKLIGFYYSRLQKPHTEFDKIATLIFLWRWESHSNSIMSLEYTLIWVYIHNKHTKSELINNLSKKPNYKFHLSNIAVTWIFSQGHQTWFKSMMLNDEYYCAELVWFINSVQGKDNVQKERTMFRLLQSRNASIPKVHVQTMKTISCMMISR